MGKINWGRVLLGGVIWCLVYMLIFAAAWYPLLKPLWTSALEALGRPFQPTAQTVGLGIALTLSVGIFSIWFYAAIRPRYGPGPKTAAGAGFAVWVIDVLLPLVAIGHGLSVSTRFIVIQSGFELVAFVVATLVGAWQYKE